MKYGNKTTSHGDIRRLKVVGKTSDTNQGGISILKGGLASGLNCYWPTADRALGPFAESDEHQARKIAELATPVFAVDRNWLI